MVATLLQHWMMPSAVQLTSPPQRAPPVMGNSVRMKMTMSFHPDRGNVWNLVRYFHPAISNRATRGWMIYFQAMTAPKLALMKVKNTSKLATRSSTSTMVMTTMVSMRLVQRSKRSSQTALHQARTALSKLLLPSLQRMERPERSLSLASLSQLFPQLME